MDTSKVGYFIIKWSWVLALYFFKNPGSLFTKKIKNVIINALKAPYIAWTIKQVMGLSSNTIVMG
jgi:hypothetical protein